MTMRRTAILTAVLGAALALLPLAAQAQGGPEATIWGAEFSAPETAQELTPTTIALPGMVAQVGTSNSTEYALLANGELWSWGLNTFGQLGDGTTVDSPTTPVEVDFPAGVTIASLATDAMPYNAALAIDTNGNAWGWGDNATGALCANPKTDPEFLDPVELAGLSDVSLVAGASAHAIFDAGGSLYACGSYQFGSLGTGKKGEAYTPTAVVGMQDVDAVSVEASSVDSGVVLANGEVWNWGSNAEGQLGTGLPLTATSDVPVEVPLPAAATQLAMGGNLTTNGSSLVELSNGEYWAWGDDQYGELGDGQTTTKTTPVQFTPPVAYTILAASGGTGYGVTAVGAVYAWGLGTSCQLGNGTKSNSRTPIEVISSGVTGISTTAHDVVVLP